MQAYSKLIFGKNPADLEAASPICKGTETLASAIYSSGQRKRTDIRAGAFRPRSPVKFVAENCG